MSTLSERWRNSAVARETASIARSRSYRAPSGVEVDLPEGTDEPFSLITAPHFNIMQLSIHHGNNPSILGIMCDVDALSAAVVVTKSMRSIVADVAAASDVSSGALGDGLSPVTSAAMRIASTLANIGAVVAPLPREQPGNMTAAASSAVEATPSPAPCRVALLGAIGGSGIGGWASTGALGLEEDLMRRTDLAELSRNSAVLRKAYPLGEGCGLWSGCLRVFRGPAADPAAASTAASPATASPAAISPFGTDDAMARLVPTDYGLMDEPVEVGFVGVVPPINMIADRSLSSDEACIKPSSRRTLLLAAHNQLSTAAAAGFTVLVIDALGLGCAGCSAPPVAVARLYRKILYTYFAGVFQAVVFASGGVGVEAAAVLADAASAPIFTSTSASMSSALSSGSGDVLCPVDDVAAAAAALATNDPSLWDAEADTIPEESETGTECGDTASGDAQASRAAAAAADTSRPVKSGARSSRIRRFHPSLRAWSLTDSDPTRGTPPPAAAAAAAAAGGGGVDGSTARALALLPALLPSAIAMHPGRAFLHVFAATAIGLPAPATTNLRHRFGVDSTPAESSLVRRRRRATRVIERAERASVPGGAAAAALTDAGKVVVAALSGSLPSMAGSPASQSSSFRGRGWSTASGRGSRKGSNSSGHAYDASGHDGVGVSIGGYVAPSVTSSVNGSTVTASSGRRSDAESATDASALLHDGGLELAETSTDGVLASDVITTTPHDIAGAIAFAAPGDSSFVGADEDII